MPAPVRLNPAALNRPHATRLLLVPAWRRFVGIDDPIEQASRSRFGCLGPGRVARIEQLHVAIDVLHVTTKDSSDYDGRRACSAHWL